MKKNEIIERINELIAVTQKKSSKLRMAFVTSIQCETQTINDFSKQSVCTTYLSRKDCDDLLNNLRGNGIYTKLYTDVEDFFYDYYSGHFNCNIVFETSPKGIAKGKDILIPSFCDSVGLLHVGPDASSIMKCINKYQWYCILKENRIPVPNTYLFTNRWITFPPKTGKYLLKLTEECASIGLTDSSVFQDNLNLMTSHAEKLSIAFNESIICQQFIDGYEVEVPVLSNKDFSIILPPVGIKYHNKKFLNGFFFNYDTIYDNGYGVYLFEKEMNEINKIVRTITQKVVEILDLKGYFRIDFRITKEGAPFIIDINNDPTLNDEGSFQYSIKSIGFSKKDLVAMIIGNYLINQSKIEYQ